MAGKGGGAWKVAYADFVTAMMAFFMVMWLVGQDEEKKEAVAEYFQDPWGTSKMTLNRTRNPTLRKQKAGQTDPGKEYRGSNPRQVPHDDPESPDFKQPKLTTVRAPERTTAGAIISFSDGSLDIDENGKEKLKLLIPQIVGLPHKIDIRGHVSPSMASIVDEDQMFDLSYRRSRAVLRFLRELGIEEERMRISVAGHHEPLFLKSNKADSNARVEVFLLTETVANYRLADETAPKAKVKEVKVDESDATDTSAKMH
jgi:chemotaxis protein MotB